MTGKIVDLKSYHAMADLSTDQSSHYANGFSVHPNPNDGWAVID